MQDFKQLGVGLAAAILLDATAVRLLLVPAIMSIAGPRQLVAAQPAGPPAPAPSDRMTPCAGIRRAFHGRPGPNKTRPSRAATASSKEVSFS